jgi:predicted kinase
MGVPGSGKSTHAKAHAQGRLFSADAIRNQGADAESHMEAVRRAALAALRQGEDVTVDACNVHAAPRRALLRIAEATGATTRLRVLPVTLAQAMRGQRGRAHPVPRAALVKYMQQWPSAMRAVEHEAWDEVEVVERGH